MWANSFDLDFTCGFRYGSVCFWSQAMPHLGSRLPIKPLFIFLLIVSGQFIWPCQWEGPHRWSHGKSQVESQMAGRNHKKQEGCGLEIQYVSICQRCQFMCKILMLDIREGLSHTICAIPWKKVHDGGWGQVCEPQAHLHWTHPSL